MKKKSLLLLFLLNILIISAQHRIFVSPHGDSSGNGSLQHPFVSIQQAVNSIDKTIDTSIEILLREGRYDLTKTVEINPNSWQNKQITVKPYNHEKVSVTGGKSIRLSNAKKVTEQAAIRRIQKEFLSKIKVIDLKKEGVVAADLMPVGFSRPSVPAWTELFVDGKPMRLSRWPNDTVKLIGKIYNAGNVPQENIYDKGGAEFGYDDPRPARWKNAPQVWIAGYFAYGYADDMVRVASIDTVKKSITTLDNSVYGFKTGASFRTWHALNLLEELDVPGEYVLDAKEGKIYFYPPADKLSQIDISMLQGPLLAIEKTGNITIENITFEFTRGMGVYMEQTENVLLKGCTFRNIGNVAVCIGKGDMPTTVKNNTLSAEVGGKDSSRVLGSILGRLYTDIFYDRNGGRNNGIMDCNIYNVGAGGVSLGGGSRATLTPAGNFVDNCRISNYNRINRSYHGAINMDGVGNRISHCEIFNAPSMAILFHGNDHLIEYCDIHDVCNEVDDQGAIYYGRDVSERGNQIRYCYFHDFDSKHRVTATYHDDGACDSRVEGCIYYKAGTIPALIGGGHDHQYINNIFMNSPIAIHIDNRMQGWGVGMVAKDGILNQRLKTVRYTEPPYSTRYPAIVNYWNENPAMPKRNTITRNLFYKVGTVLSGRTEWGEFWNNWSATTEDPGFVDENNPLKGFKPNARVFEKIPGFQEIPFDKIGCKLSK
jgi:hypothetical protein